METEVYIINNNNNKYELSRDVFNKIHSLDSEASKYISECLIENKKATEFHFRRQTTCTTCILDYFVGDNLHMPNDLCPTKFMEEITFWGIQENEIGICCYNKYVSFFEDKKALKLLENDEKKRNETKEFVYSLSSGSGWSAVQARIWKIMEYPKSSISAKIFFVVSNTCVILSLFVLVCSTDPTFKRSLTQDEWKDFFTDDEEKSYGYASDEDTAYHYNETFEKKPTDVLATMEFIIDIEYLLTAYFTVEILCRLVFSPLPWKHFLNFLNIVDIVAVSVMYMQIIENEIDNKEKYEKSFTDDVHSLQVFRVFRFFRLAKYTSGFRVLAFTLRASAMDLLLLLLCLFTAVMTFSALAFFSRDEVFTSIPVAAWWAIITLTTVGYGDVVPKSGFGKLIASACAITGVCLLAMLIPILVNNFLLFLTHSKVLEKRAKVRTEISMLKDTIVFRDKDKGIKQALEK